MKDSIVLFMDALGSKKWATGPDAQEYLNKLHAVITKNREKILSKSGGFATLTFTDNVVLGCPIDSDDFVDSSSGLGIVSLLASTYQAELAAQGIFVRGAIFRGLLYMDEKIAFGPGLVHAYELEQASVYPRIVLSVELTNLAKLQPMSLLNALSPDSLPDPEDLVNVDFVRDQDGLTFLNYLAILPFINDDKQGNLLAHKAHVEYGLKAFAADAHIWDKYRWLADYHNFTISRNHAGHPNYLISEKIIRSQFLLNPLSKLAGHPKSDE